MNFTREPIIETIVAPREGYRLLIRNSKHRTGDEFFVDAVEMVSFGAELFFRCLEKPKPFLLPVSDYEVLEVKETRLAVKGVQMEKSIKIGGREGSGRHKEESSTEEGTETTEEKPSIESRKERRHKRRRHGGEKKEHPRATHSEETKPQEESTKGQPSKATILVPPPSGLVSEKLSRVREDEHKVEDQSNEPPIEGNGEIFIYQQSVMDSISEPPSFTSFQETEDPPPLN